MEILLGLNFQSTRNYMLWAQCKRNQLNPITLSRENVQNVQEILGNFETTKSDHILDVFSGQVYRIELIPFALCQASRDNI